MYSIQGLANNTATAFRDACIHTQLIQHTELISTGVHERKPLDKPNQRLSWGADPRIGGTSTKDRVPTESLVDITNHESWRFKADRDMNHSRFSQYYPPDEN
jgi:hypothetical protein